LKAFLGVFQIGSMNELSIKLRHAADLITDDNFKRLIRANQVGSIVMAVVYFFFCFFAYTFYDWCQTYDNPSTALKRACTYTTPSVFISLSIGLTSSVIYLLLQIKHHFNRQVLVTEEGRVKTICLVFTLAYVTRSVHLLLFGLLVDMHDQYRFPVFNIYYFIFLNFWDVLPLTLIMSYHRTCFQAQQRELEEDQKDAQS